MSLHLKLNMNYREASDTKPKSLFADAHTPDLHADTGAVYLYNTQYTRLLHISHKHSRTL